MMSGEKPDYRKKQDDAERKRRESEEHADRQQIVSSLERVAEQNKATDDQSKRADRFHRRIEKLSLRLEGRKYWLDLAETAGLWFAAIVGVVAIIVSTTDSTGQRKVMQHQLNEMQAEQRAWIGPQNASLESPITLNQPDSIFITVQNTGREPARNLVNSIGIGYWRKATETTDAFNNEVNTFARSCERTKPIDGAQILFPTNGFGSGFTFSQPIPKEKIDADFIAGRVVLIAVGCVVYETGGQSHHSSFCYAYTNGVTKVNALNLCYVGNKSD